MIKKIGMMVCALVGMAVVAFGGDKYVAAEGVESLSVNGVSYAVTHNDIQAAIDDESTVAGDTIWVEDGFVCDSGEYSGNGLNRLLLNKAVTVRSVSGTYENGVTVVGAWHSDTTTLGSKAVRGVYISAEATLMGFVITNGATTTSRNTLDGGGGGVNFDGCGIVTNCLITDCYGSYGGALAAAGANAIGGRVYTSVIQNCKGVAYAGVLFVNSKCGSKNFELINCRAINNSAATAGGLYRGTARGCWFEGNKGNSGGALGYDSIGYNCVITNNTSNYGGGCGAREGTGPLVYDSVIVGNHATTSGGGVESGKFYNCIIKNNTSDGTGGGAVTVSTSSYLYNCVVQGNHAAGNGGASSGGYFYNCTVYDNTSDADYSGLYKPTGVYNTISWGNVNSTSGTWQNSCAAEASGTGCITDDPLLTIDAISGLPVFASKLSPCIDKCDTKNANIWDVDILGNPRLSGEKYDMGAVEYLFTYDDILIVVGVPYEMGAVDFEYGEFDGVAVGMEKTYTVTDGIIEYAEMPGVQYRCAGYSIYTNMVSPAIDTTRSGEGNICEYLHKGWAKLQWNFEVAAYNINIVSALGGSVTGDGWLAAGSEATLVATADDGMVFDSWIGDTDGFTEEQIKQATLTFTVDKPRSLTAFFKDANAQLLSCYVYSEGETREDLGPAFSDLQTAIDMIDDGGTVWVADGYVCDDSNGYSEDATYGKSRIRIDKPITVRSVSGSYEGGAMIIGRKHSDSETLGTDAVRGVYISTNAVLFGFVITNGATSSNGNVLIGGGGGVNFSGAGIVSNSLITHCYSTRGGGIGVSSAKAKGAKVYSSVIKNCNATAYAGVAFVHTDCGSTNFELIDCRMLNNSAATAGCLYRGTARNCWLEGNRGNSGGALGYDTRGYNCVITNNTSNYGGGCGAREGTGPLVYDSIIVGNHATTAGGGAESGIFNNCVIKNNTSDGDGGGVVTIGTASYLYNCVVEGNYAKGNGGGTSGAIQYNCVIMNNHAEGLGGGVSGGTLENCTVYGNTSDSEISGINSGSSVKINNTISWNNTDADEMTWTYSCSTKASGTGCTTDDPLLVIDATSGLPVFSSGASPCVNTGTTKNSKTPDTDILGNARLSGSDYDMGAVEYDASGNDKVMIEGDIANLGSPEPAYGILGNVAVGSEIVFTFPNPTDIDNPNTPGVHYSCVGYEVRANDEENTLLASGEGTTFTYTHAGAATVHWLFAVTHYVITAGDAHGGTIDGVGVAEANAEVTLTATPDDNMVFVRWMGDTEGIAEDALTNPILTFTATKPITLHALFNAVGAPNSLHYVSESGMPNATYGIGHSSLQLAIDAAEEGDTVWIEDGYVCDEGYTMDKYGARSRIVIDKPITVRSVKGTAESNVLIVGATHSETVTQGDNSIRCVYMGSGAQLIGVITTNGFTKATDDAVGTGGCILFGSAGATVLNCYITSGEALYAGGVGAYNGATDCKVIASVISKCSGKYGNAIMAWREVGNNLVVQRCLFIDIDGAIMHRGTAKECIMTECDGYLTSEGAQTFNCFFTNNYYNCVREGNHYNGYFVGNKTDSNAAYNAALYNCTVYGNKKGVGGTAKLYNSIVWGNDTDINSSTVTFVNSCSPTLTPGENGNTNEDPRFKFNEDGIPVPIYNSPCVDTGDNQYVVTDGNKDFLGKPRIRRGRTEKLVDMGCVEVAPAATIISLE